MKHSALYLVFIIFLLLCAVPVSATVINSSAVLSTQSATVKYDYVESTTSYQFDIPSGSGLAMQMMNAKYEGSITKFVYTRASGNVITGSIALASIGPTTGIVTRTIDGGTSSSIVYFKIPFVNPVYVLPTYTTEVVDSESTQYYLVMADDVGSFKTGSLYSFDDATACYIKLSTPLSQDPIVSIVTTTDGNGIEIRTSYQTVSSMQNDENVAKTTKHDRGLFDLPIIDALYSVYLAISGFLQTAAMYISFMALLGTLFFAASTFLVLNAMYIVISMVLAVHGTTNWVTASKRFIHSITKLLDFYHKIFMYIKDTLKWW